ncbi:hypothetical protein BQ9231_00617 [Cedratvirus lausannensis]|uniref:Uncharacterized protein n=1 Tax=Cedratvirus lausannensis TaxID=2023205 RepID=A0A285Q380_9VIRU|nr:hypothetical protein BQ9231_00617 [Cedratvirus lausannensis]
MFRTKKPLKTNKRIHEDVQDVVPSQIKSLEFLKTLSSPKVERETPKVERKDSFLPEDDLFSSQSSPTQSECRLEQDQLRETLYKLGNSLYYLASIIPNENSWNCHFVDTPPHKDNLTRAKDNIITISATLNSMVEQFILLPFGDKPMECGFSRQVEFTLTCSLGKTTVDAYHVCERGVHKLIFPEEVVISGKEYNLKSILPVRLEH